MTATFPSSLFTIVTITTEPSPKHQQGADMVGNRAHRNESDQ